MKAVRALSILMVALLATPALTATAQPSSHLVRLTGWSSAVDVRGLNEGDSSDVEALWDEFVTEVPAHTACLLASPPRIEARSDMAPRAAYAPGSGTLYVKPGDLDRLVVFHELAHHLDFTCGAADTIGDDVRRAQGIPLSKAWWKEGSPITWPAEYFANAVAIALGENSRHDVTADTVAVVEEWMGRTRPAVEVPTVVPVTIDDFATSIPRIA